MITKSVIDGRDFVSQLLREIRSDDTPIVVCEKIIGPTGFISIGFTSNPTMETYNFILKYIRLRKKSLRSLTEVKK